MSSPYRENMQAAAAMEGVTELPVDGDLEPEMDQDPEPQQELEQETQH